MRVFFYFLSAALVLFLAVVPAYSQHQDQNTQGESSFRVRLETPVGWSLWDDSRNELITSGGAQHPSDRAVPLVNIYNVVSGEKRSIDIFSEFSNALYINVDGLAVGPEGSVLVACEVNLDNGAFAGERLLLYDNHSTLITNLTAARYYVGAVAVDKESNIYVVGIHDDERSSKESYPLIVRYDSHGHTTLTMLPRSLFPNVDDPVGGGFGNPHIGATRLAVSKKAVEVYLALASELIVLNQAGEIQTRVNVASRLSEFAKTNGFRTVSVDGDEFSPSGDLWLVGQLLEPSDSTSASLPARNFVVLLTPEGQLHVPYERVGQPPDHYLPQLIGFTQSSEPVGSFSTGGSDYLFVQKGPY
jgi:hypothetical protein